MLALLLSLAFCIQKQKPRRPQIVSKNTYSNKKHTNIPDNADSCEMCTEVVDYIEYLINNTFVETEVAALVSLLCQTLPFPVSTGCSFIVNHYIPLIMKLIEQDLESLEICNKIGFCSALQVDIKQNVRLPKNLKKNSRISNKYRKVYDQKTCLMCKEVIAYAEAAIQDEKIEEQVIEVIDQVCQSFSAPLDNLCSRIITLSVPTIMTWIEEGIEAIDICVRLLLCDS